MKITDRCARQGDELLLICDFSPLKSGQSEAYAPAQDLDADFICVAYLPGKAVRASSMALAQVIREISGRDAIFNLGTRDINKLAIQSLLLGAQLSGLENVLVLRGDPFTQKQLASVKQVDDFRPTELIHAINQMNQGLDYKGLKLDSPTDFCVGATADLSRGLQAEAALTARKVSAGAHFIVTQPVFEERDVDAFLRAFAAVQGGSLAVPIFWGLQVFAPGGFIFSHVPEWIQRDLEGGREGTEIALQVMQGLRRSGFKRFYLIPPILKGGARDYRAAQQVISGARQG